MIDDVVGRTDEGCSVRITCSLSRQRTARFFFDQEGCVNRELGPLRRPVSNSFSF